MDPDKSGTVTYIEFVKKLYALKATDGSFLLEQIKYYIIQVRDQIVTSMNANHAELHEAVKSDKAEGAGADADADKPLLEESYVPANNTVAIDITEEKEQKASLQEPLPPAQVKGEAKDKALRAAGAVRDQTTSDSREGTMTSRSDEVLEALTSVSKLFQEEFRDTLRRIELVNEQQASNTSKLLSQLTPQKGDDVVTIPQNIASGNSRLPGGCCNRV